VCTKKSRLCNIGATASPDPHRFASCTKFPTGTTKAKKSPKRKKKAPPRRQQYRAKAAEFRAFLTNTPRSPKETSEFRDLEQTYTTLAENEEWMAVHLDKTIQRRKDSENRTAIAEEEEQILKCLGAAVLMRWNTVPTKLQRELFDCASTIVDLQQTTPLKGQIARFLHNHKNDAQKSG
jgi:hypothetical protein